MEFYKFDLHLNYFLAATFLPVLINFAILVFSPEKAQKVGKALIFQLAGLVLLPVVAGGIMKIAGAEPKTISFVILVLECIGALVMLFYAIPGIKAKEKAVWGTWILGAFSLVLWGASLYKMVLQQTM